MSRIRFYLILCLSLCWNSIASCQIPEEQVARQFLSDKIPEVASKDFAGFDKSWQFGTIRIIENDQPAFFVLVKRTDRLRIVGYSLQNCFSREDTLSPATQLMLETLSSAKRLPYLDNPLKSTCKPIGPLIQTRWSQEDFFNFFCPENENLSDGHVYVGCAAVALGQIVRYYGKFNDFFLSASFTNPTFGVLSATVGNFDWMRMENQPVTLDTETSKLLYGLGVLTHMGYGNTSSSTSNFMVYDAAKKLKYLNAKRMIRSTTDPLAWINNFYQNIMEFKPIYVSGSGHSFVCDGIDSTGMFHFNLGWYGFGDGYYPLDLVLIFNPSEAIFDLEPYSTLFAPMNLVQETISGQTFFRWNDNPLSTERPSGYRIYLNDTLFYESRLPSFSSADFPPGNHSVMVSSLYTQGESRWIGPIPCTVAGPRVIFQDPVLENIVIEEINVHAPGIRDSLTAAGAMKIKSLIINQPVKSLNGLESCINLQSLTVDCPGLELDLRPLVRLKRLKSLEISNITIRNIQLIANNTILYKLLLDSSSLSGISFLTGMDDLIDLSIKDIPLEGTAPIDSMKQLVRLTLTGCGLNTAEFVQPLTNLKYLDLSNNSIPRIRWTEKFFDLKELNLSGNQLSDLFFLDKILNIKNLNLNSNQLIRFTTGSIYPNLTSLSLAFNQIDSLSFIYPVVNLKYLDADGNRIRTIRKLKDYSPNLISLKLAGNQLHNLWSGSLQHLEFLDVSDNQISQILSIPDNPSLIHVSVAKNRVTDLHPLLNRRYAGQLHYFNISGNPLSTESMNAFIPELLTMVDTIIMPDEAQRLSPGYPNPIRNSALTGTQAELSWKIQGDPGEVRFDLLTGVSPDNLAVTYRDLHLASCRIDINPGQAYYWAVRTHSADSSFLSGIFCFYTYQTITLPFSESFETYLPFAYITDLSPMWIKPWNGSPEMKDGRIYPYRSSNGSQSLTIGSEGGVVLPLDHLYQNCLYITQRILVETGRKACLRFTGINGGDLELFFKSNGRCDIILNQEFQREVVYPQNKWFFFQLVAFASGNELNVSIGELYISLPWLFPQNIVHMTGMEYKCSSGPYWPQDGFPMFYVDNIGIKATGSVSVETMNEKNPAVIYPNPADGYFNFLISNILHEQDLILYDSSGKRVCPDIERISPEGFRVNTSGLTAGIYYLRLARLPAQNSIRILVTH